MSEENMTRSHAIVVIVVIAGIIIGIVVALAQRGY
jgi:hypothetical protein